MQIVVKIKETARRNFERQLHGGLFKEMILGLLWVSILEFLLMS